MMHIDEDPDVDVSRGRRDRSLGFHWSTPNTDLIRFLGIRNAAGPYLRTVNSMLTEAVLAAHENRWVSYSRHEPYYSDTKRYRGASYTYKSVKRAIDELVSLGLIEEDRSKPGQRGRQSTFHATPMLMESWVDGPYDYYLQEVVLLKDDEGKLKKYDDTDKIRKWRRDIRDYNKYIGSFRLDFSDPHIVRTAQHFIIEGKKGQVFVRRDQHAMNRMFLRGSFDCYGRGHGPWQNIPKSYRHKVTINGEPVAEPDFRRAHPTMLYHERGIEPTADPYEVDGYDPEDVKFSVLVLLNADNYQEAFGAITNRGKPDWLLSDRDTHRMIKAIKLHHAPIASSFHNDCGMKLMRTESDIIFDVLNRCVKADIPAFPIHDSVMTPVRHQSRVVEFMEASYAKRFPGVTPCVIGTSCPPRPHMGEGCSASSLFS